MIDIDLRNPALAALLAWLWPGAGHLYQRRYGKGLLFMICILSTWFFGLAIGEGHSVYASNRTIAQQLMYGCQLGTGLPAMPALVQSYRVRQNEKPLWNGAMAPPTDQPDELHAWSFSMGLRYDMGVLYTMVAGLLNVLAIFDAYAGPMIPAPDEKKETGDEKKGKERDDKADNPPPDPK